MELVKVITAGFVTLLPALFLGGSSLYSDQIWWTPCTTPEGSGVRDWAREEHINIFSPPQINFSFI